MTRGRATNEAFLYQRATGEADHQHTAPVTVPGTHVLRRDNSYSAAHHFRQILARVDRLHTMHDHAEHTAAEHLPTVIADLLPRNDQRRTARRAAWQEQSSRARSFPTRHDRATASIGAAQQASRRTGAVMSFACSGIG